MSAAGCYGCGGPVTLFGGLAQPAIIDPFTGRFSKRVARWWTKCSKCGVVTVREEVRVTDPATARYEIGVLIGPCSQAECETLMEAILDLPETSSVGGVVSCGPWREDDEPMSAYTEPTT